VTHATHARTRFIARTHASHATHATQTHRTHRTTHARIATASRQTSIARIGIGIATRRDRRIATHRTRRTQHRIDARISIARISIATASHRIATSIATRFTLSASRRDAFTASHVRTHAR
jgi:hypothetical protein